MLGQVVIDAERVLAVVEEVLAHRAARVRSDELDRGGLVGRSGDDDGVVHRAGVFEHLLELDDGRHALADRHVDADDVRVLVVDDRVDRDRGLAGLAVADDQLALAAADRDHAVDRLEPRLKRLDDRLALDDAGSLELGGARLGRVDLALVVKRAPERVDHAAEELLADGDLEELAGALDLVALDDLVPLAEEHGADVVLLEVEGEARHVMGQLEHLERHAVLEAMDASDAVCDLKDGADLRELLLVGVEILNPVSQDVADLVWANLHCFQLLFMSRVRRLNRLRDFLSQSVQLLAQAGVEHHVPHAKDKAAEDLLVDVRLQDRSCVPSGARSRHRRASRSRRRAARRW